MSAAPPPDSRNANTLWAGVLVETLVRCGVRHAAISPGSRSAPLAFACAAHPGLEAISVLDERSAGFLGLGLAKVSGRPTALVCTSGTAAANYLPALVEARESGVPLLALTSDRPPELRSCAAGQAIDQQKLYGNAVSFFHELAMPEAREPLLRYLRQTVAHAVSRTLGPSAGPVHLNVPFRDPLPPLPDDGAVTRVAAAIDWPSFFSHLALPQRPVKSAAWPEFAAGVRGLIVSGSAQLLRADDDVTVVADIARRLGWPVLADGLSSLRQHAARISRLVTTYDTILRRAEVAEDLRPEVVICLGDWPASKVLRAWIETTDPEIWQVNERTDNRDALHGRTRFLQGDLSDWAASLPEAGETEPAYARKWMNLEVQVRAEIDRRLAGEESLFEPKAVWLLGKHLPSETPLVVANSMPVRDLEYVMPPANRGIRPWCNRGANGIDGTLSTALGVAWAANRPTVLLTGDLALLHDSNGLLLQPRFPGSLTVVLINNRGGGIFEHLPVAQFDPPFEEFFATPQGIDFARLCAAHGVEHVLVRNWAHFTQLVAQLPGRGLRVLELPTDRQADAARRRQWFEEFAAGIRM